jgi:hypothetical protein
MTLRLYAVLLFLAFLLGSCGKLDDMFSNNNRQDTLTQYLEYTINGQPVRLMANDTITFLPGFTTLRRGNDTTDFIYTADMTVSVEHRMENQSIFRHNSFSFILRPAYNQLDWLNEMESYYTPILNQRLFDSMFLTGQMDYLAQNCYDSIPEKAHIEISFPFYYDFYKSYKSSSGCVGEYEQNYCRQDSSYFRIIRSRKYQHKQFGACTLLEGEFAVTLYYAAGAPWMEKLTIRNGKYRFVVTNNRWR